MEVQPEVYFQMAATVILHFVNDVAISLLFN